MAAGGHGAFAPRPCRAKIAAILKPSKERTRRKSPTTTNKKPTPHPDFPWKVKKKPTNKKPCPKCQPPPADFGNPFVRAPLLPTPSELIALLDKKVVGQTEAKRTLAVAAYYHFLGAPWGTDELAGGTHVDIASRTHRKRKIPLVQNPARMPRDTVSLSQLHRNDAKRL